MHTLSRTHALLLAVVLLLASPLVPARTEDADLEARLAALVTEHDFAGVVLVEQAGEVVLESAHGLADRESGAANTPATRFRIASLSKTFTAVLVLQLVEDGRLALEDTLAERLPAYPADYADRVTVEHLLTHRSGISHYIDLPGWFDGAYADVSSREAFLDAIAALPLNAAPGARYRYSNANYYLLGLIIERTLERPFEDVLRTRILEPLGLRCTGHFSGAHPVEGMAQNYLRDEVGGHVRARPVNAALFTATASLYACAADLLVWTRSFTTDTLLDDASRARMFDPDAAIGWTVAELDGRRAWTYNGEINGYTSLILALPESRDVVVLLNNDNAGYDALATMAVSLAEAIHAAEGTEP